MLFNSKILFLGLVFITFVKNQLIPDGRNLQGGTTDPPASDPETPSPAPPVLKCGRTNSKGETYKTWDEVSLCLVFPTFNGGAKKVLFTPRIDKFEVL